MKNKEILDLYSDYLISSVGGVSATQFSEVLGGLYSHDKITRTLSQDLIAPKEYWKIAKPLVRAVETDVGFISVDDTIEHKPHSGENDYICWHFDHTTGNNVLGINILTLTYVGELSPSGVRPQVALAFEVVRKDNTGVDKVTGKEKRKASVGKNELLRERLRVLTFVNKVKYRTVLWDTWFSSVETMEYVVRDLGKHFIGALKDNRLISFDVSDRKKGDKQITKEGGWKPVSGAGLEAGRAYKVRIKELPFDVLIVKVVYKNDNGTTGVAYLLASDTELSGDDIISGYQKRWAAEETHKTTKQNCALTKFPGKVENSQINHIFTSFWATLKLESIKLATNQHHYKIKRNLLLAAVKAAWAELQALKAQLLEKNLASPIFGAA